MIVSISDSDGAAITGQDSESEPMKSDDRSQRDVHALDENGMVLCNARDKEASHRAAMGDISVGTGKDVTCRKCMKFQRRFGNSLDPEVEESTLLSNSQDSPMSTEPSQPFVRIRGLAAMAADYRPGDGIDPKEEKRKALRSRRQKKTDHSTERLANQILDALSLSSILSDVGLDDFVFAAVQPSGSGGQFLVDVRCRNLQISFDLQDIERQLKLVSGRFRHEISIFVRRRRVPELQFRVLPFAARAEE